MDPLVVSPQGVWAVVARLKGLSVSLQESGAIIRVGSLAFASQEQVSDMESLEQSVDMDLIVGY